MSATEVALLEEPDRVRLALSPLRRWLLERLQEPASASQLASELDLSRQRVNYHLRALEQAGLVELVEERQRRGFVERILRASAGAFVVDPAVMGDRPPTPARDRFAATHLIGAAGGIVRDVARMQVAAQQQGARLLTFTIETEVAFARPADVERFTDALAEAVSRIAAEFHAPEEGRRYRVVAGGHPAARAERSD
jgi:DNA-binding transcriptional ArsR family regulator